MSKVTIKHVFFAPKCAYVNFQNTKAPDVFYNVAVASRKRYIWGDNKGEPYMVETIPEDQFREALQVGKEVEVRWSKSASSYFVHF